MTLTHPVLAASALVLLAGASRLAAQPIGTFRWQLQPFCNVVTLQVTRTAGVYTLDGFDDQCGAAVRAGVVGIAFLNPDGSVGMGLTAVGAPGAMPAHIDARIDLESASGPWQDNAGNSGTFVFTPGPSAGGAPRPVAPNGVAPGSITSAQIAPGAVGAAHLTPGVIGAAQIDPSQVQARVSGTCPVGQYLRGFHQDGSVTCEPILAADVSTTVDDPAQGVGRYTSIAIGTDGLPIVSYWDFTAGGLRVTHCGNVTCTEGNVSTTIDDPPNGVGYYTSIAIGADGLPIISHFEDTADALRVTHCGNAACTAGNVSTTVDDPANTVGLYTSIAIGADGLPIISHQDQTAGALRVTHCGNPSCTEGNVSTTVDDPATVVGYYTSVAIGADGVPIVSHHDGTARTLRIAHCGNPACTSGNIIRTLDESPFSAVGEFTSTAIGADGLPIISYRDATAGALRVIGCSNATCSASGGRTVDSPANSVGGDTSIAIGADGLPIISHFDRTAGALRVTKCATRHCR